jgi:uncharacterized caspase-like protein
VLVSVVACRFLVISLVLVLAGCSAPSIEEPSRRVALVIGNAGYKSVVALGNPLNDSRDVAAALTRLGFRTELLRDASREEMAAAVRRLSGAAERADVAVLFYAGHATEVGGHNVLLPVSAAIVSTPEDLQRESVSFDEA